MRSVGRIVKTVSDRRGLLLFGILAASALVVLGFVVPGTSLMDRAPVEVNQQAASDPAGRGCSDAPASDSACSREEHQEEHREAASEPIRTSRPASTDCSDESSTSFACLQKRYQNLVRGPGIEAAFTELKNELTRNELAKSN